MGMQKRLAQLGFAKQTAKGVPAAAPTNVIGVSSGTVLDAEIQQDELPTTWSGRGLEGHDRTGVVPMADFEAPALPKTLGLLFLLALGSDTVTGSTAPFTHLFAPASQLLYTTLFPTYAGEKWVVQDAKVDSLELTWDKSGALKIKVKFLGCATSWAQSWTFPNSAGERVADGIFEGAGGIFQIDGTAARIISGSVKIENGVEAILASYSTSPDDVFEQDVKVSLSLVVKPDNNLLWRRTTTGTAAGTAVQSGPAYGTATAKWVLDANTDLTFDTRRLSFITQLPPADPAGGAAEVTLSGSCSMQPAGGGPQATFTLRNSVASY